jgi:hypothetical protein
MLPPRLQTSKHDLRFVPSSVITVTEYCSPLSIFPALMDRDFMYPALLLKVKSPVNFVLPYWSLTVLSLLRLHSSTALWLRVSHGTERRY